MMNKQLTAADAVAQLRDGMTIGFGGWGPRRKPMAIVREILRSPVKDLTVVAYGGPEVGMLCAAGKVKKLVFGFATLDAIPLEPYYRKAREAGELELLELDEGMFQWGLRAAVADQAAVGQKRSDVAVIGRGHGGHYAGAEQQRGEQAKG